MANVRLADAGELEDGAEVAPVAALGACDRGLHSLQFFQITLGFLSLLRSWVAFCFCPTAYAVGCVLSPLCGWFCGGAFLRCASLCGLRIGLGFDLDY
jgi:hypothetical protein